MTLAQAYRKQFGKVSFPFRIYDADGNKTYAEHSNGFWQKYEYDSKGNETYVENSVGCWWKYESDTNGNNTYYETSNSYWSKREYDTNGNETYYENSNGVIRGSKQNQSCEGKVVEIDGKKYKLKEL